MFTLVFVPLKKQRLIFYLIEIDIFIFLFSANIFAQVRKASINTVESDRLGLYEYSGKMENSSIH